MRALEDVLRESGLEWAILRPGGFASNALWWAETVRAQQVVAAPFGDVGVPIIDPADIAAVAAACLLDDRHTGGVYELTGPEVITPRQQAEAIAAALGSPVRFHELTRDEAKTAMTQSMPAGACRRHSGHPRLPEPGRAARQPGRPAGPRPRPSPLRRLGRPQCRRVPLRLVSAAGTAFVLGDPLLTIEEPDPKLALTWPPPCPRGRHRLHLHPGTQQEPGEAGQMPPDGPSPRRTPDTPEPLCTLLG